MDLGPQGGLGDAGQHLLLLLRSNGDLHVIQDLQSFILGFFKTLGDDPGVETFVDEDFSLFQKLSDQENSRRGPVSGYVILENITVHHKDP